MFQNKVIVITGGAGGIGKCIVEEFKKQGAMCASLTAQKGTTMWATLPTRPLWRILPGQSPGNMARWTCW